MRNINPIDYNKYANDKAPKTNYIKNCIWAFLVGGAICTIGQIIMNYLLKTGLSKQDASTSVSIILIFIGALLTGLGVYDKIGKRAGAGSIVPITGFANSIVSPAMEFKREGYIFGVCAKMFVIAGPVLVYGFGSSVVAGLIYFILSK
ncbi:stage V sporulation protein AC [Clostridiaceae bacterium M8S5]|nr:stage V sporulation protein AC [Clostridiaceae bacterium M8S5]